MTRVLIVLFSLEKWLFVKKMNLQLLVTIVLSIFFILSANVRKNNFSTCLFCNDHLFSFSGRNFFADLKKKCKCKNLNSYDVCGFCCFLRYLLNFKCNKVCLENIQSYFIERTIPSDIYLKKLNCDPFFFVSKSTGLIEVALDNPEMKPITAETDHQFFPFI